MMQHFLALFNFSLNLPSSNPKYFNVHIWIVIKSDYLIVVYIVWDTIMWYSLLSKCKSLFFAVLFRKWKEFYATCDTEISWRLILLVHNLLATLGLTLYQCTVVLPLSTLMLQVHSEHFHTQLYMYIYMCVFPINIPFRCLGNGVKNAYCMSCMYL